MKTYAPDQIRNIALAGHASKGKTTLLEAMLHLAGATERAGKVADGNTVTDFDAEEKKRHISMASAVASVEYKSKKTPPVCLTLSKGPLRDCAPQRRR